MILNLTATARAGWLALDRRGTAAVEQLLAGLADRDEAEPIDALASADVGYYVAELLAAEHVLVLITDRPSGGRLIFAIGAPT